MALHVPCCPHSVSLLPVPAPCYQMHSLLPTYGLNYCPSPLISCLSGFPETHPLLLAASTPAVRCFASSHIPSSLPPAALPPLTRGSWPRAGTDEAQTPPCCHRAQEPQGPGSPQQNCPAQRPAGLCPSSPGQGSPPSLSIHPTSPCGFQPTALFARLRLLWIPIPS